MMTADSQPDGKKAALSSMLNTPKNLVAQGRLLIGNKASLVGTIGVEEEPSVKVLQVASVVANNTYKVDGVLGHYLVFGKDSVEFSDGTPMRAKFGEAEDAVIFSFKLNGRVTYLYGITVPALIQWKPPAKATDLIDESHLLQSWKATHSDIKELVPLVNTETHKDLIGLAEKFMSHMPSFAVGKIKDRKLAVKWCSERTYEANVKCVVDASEVLARKAAADKSKSARDQAGTESIAGGMDAKAFWSERKRMLLTAKPYYEDTFQERFIVVELDDTTGQPTTETLTALRTELRCTASSNMPRAHAPLGPRLSPLTSLARVAVTTTSRSSSSRPSTPHLRSVVSLGGGSGATFYPDRVDRVRERQENRGGERQRVRGRESQ